MRELHLRIDDLQREKDDLIAMWQGKEKEKIAHITEISSGDGNMVRTFGCTWLLILTRGVACLMWWLKLWGSEQARATYNIFSRATYVGLCVETFFSSLPMLEYL